MKRKILLLLMMVCLLTAFLGLQVHGDQYYDIRHYDVLIDVDEDNNYHITETIDVEFYSPRHGIYRDIPTLRNGIQHPLRKIKVIDPKTGDRYGKDITSTAEQTRIQIGDADIYVDGFQTYEISYTYVGGMDYDTTMDEFYFNVIGDNWDANIDQVTFTIHMPEAFNPDSVNVTSGTFGSTATNQVVFTVDGTTITGETTTPLYREFVTVALPLEEGYYTGVSNSINFFGFALLTLFTIAISFLAFKKNRELKSTDHIIPVVQFRPPSGFNAAEIAYIYNRESISNTDVSSLILNWASRGYLTIGEDPYSKKKDQMAFTKLKDLPKTSPGYEVALFNAMFRLGSQGVVTTKDLTNTFYENLNAATIGLQKKFSGKQEILVNKIQWLSKVFAILFALAYSLIFSIVATFLTHRAFSLYFIVSMIGSILIIVALSVIAAVFKTGPTAKKKLVTGLIGGFFFIVLSLIYYSFFNPLIKILAWGGSWSLLVLLIINIVYLLGLWFMVSARKYTAYANEVLGYVEGFREFLRTAKNDQMEMIYHQNPDYVYDILPYAMVLGLTKIWEDHANRLSVPPPSWYSSSRSFTPAAFTHTMNNSFASASSQPSSSSSSSGGSSGGGGGGGGGGSW